MSSNDNPTTGWFYDLFEDENAGGIPSAAALSFGVIVLVILCLISLRRLSNIINEIKEKKPKRYEDGPVFIAENNRHKWYKDIRREWVKRNAKHRNSKDLIHILFFIFPYFIGLGLLQINFYRTLKGLLSVLGVSVFLLCIFVTWYYYNGIHSSQGDFEYESPIKALNIYEDMSSPIGQILLIAFTQLGLLAMFVWGVLENNEPNFSDGTIYIFYCLAAGIQVCYIIYKDPLPRTQDERLVLLSIWAQVFSTMKEGGTIRVRKGNKDIETTHDFSISAPLQKLSLYLRFLLSCIINVCGFTIITIALPIQVAGSGDPLGFVLDVVAANYITELDDITSGVELFFLPNQGEQLGTDEHWD